MKVKDDDGNLIEVGELKPCPFCGNTANLCISSKRRYDDLCKNNGSSLLAIECRSAYGGCGLEFREYRIPDNNYYFGLGAMIARWNSRKEVKS